MTLVLSVPVSVVEVVHMVVVLNGFMATVRAVHVLMIGWIMLAVFFGSCHYALLFHRIGASLGMAKPAANRASG